MPTPMRMPSTITYEFGDVVLVHFPQSGTTARKQRPGIVVLDIGDADLVIAPVASKARSHVGDVTLKNVHKLVWSSHLGSDWRKWQRCSKPTWCGNWDCRRLTDDQQIGAP